MTVPHFEAVVVGSGFGGSVTAERLSAKGMKVLVLERGPWWGQTGSWGPSERHRDLPHGVFGLRRAIRNVRVGTRRTSRSVGLRRDGIYEMHQFDKLTCLVASGVGGGSLVYTNMIVPPPPDHFDAYPDQISAHEMAPYLDEVRDRIRPKADRRPHAKAKAFEAAVAEGLGGTVEYPELAIDFTQGEGGAADHPCLLGSPDRSKLSLDQTYLKQAVKSGATVQAMCEVETITPPDLTGEWQIRYRDLASGHSHVVSADRVVLAAGTLGTLRLLLRSRDQLGTLPRLSPAVGRHFTPNGDAASLVLGTSEKIRSGDGPSITAMHRIDGDRTHLTGEFGLPLSALPMAIRRPLSRSTILFSMGADRISANVTWEHGSLHCPASSEDDPELYGRIESQAKTIGAGYRPRRVYANVPFRPGSGRLFSVHPLGGLPMGDDPATSAIDHRGELHHYPGLFAVDGSAVQVAPGLPPSMTIAALATRQSELMISEPTRTSRKAR